VSSVRDGDSEAYLEELFRVMTGGTPAQWEHWLTKARSRCRNCGCKRLVAFDGYPGEVVYTCPKCHKPAYATFNRKAVE
jgi:Zn finger protein HypA/HybF involved in hydrogenase expression